MKHQFELAFDINDTVYYMKDNKVAASRVQFIKIEYSIDREVRVHTTYRIHDGKEFTAEQLFPTKEALLKSL